MDSPGSARRLVRKLLILNKEKTREKKKLPPDFSGVKAFAHFFV